MKYNYALTPTITEYLSLLDQQRFFIKHAPTNSQRREYVRHQSQLKSSLFSARIEGNKLTLIDVNNLATNYENRHNVNIAHRQYFNKDLQRKEVTNILQALNLVVSPQAPLSLSINYLQKLHQAVMHQLTADAGQLRTEMASIFNQAGVAVYLTPSPELIVPQLQELLIYLKTNLDHIGVKAAVAQYWFEKIHPFIDGNGRVGRLLTQFIIDHRGQYFHSLLSFEELIEQTRSDYYSYLQLESNDLTEYIEYMLSCFTQAGNTVVEQLKKETNEPTRRNLLLPRRQEILSLLEDHSYLSFDQIRRRFASVNPSTIRFDLRQLQKQEFIQKIGTTRGALYKKSGE